MTPFQGSRPVFGLLAAPYFFMSPHKFPTTVDDLVDALERLVPERVPEVGDTLEAVQRYAGKRELVLQIKHWREQRDRADQRAAAPKQRGRL